MIWPFKRKPAREVLDPGPINEDWRPGDDAECMVDGNWQRDVTLELVEGPNAGDVMTVTGVTPARTIHRGDSWYLTFKSTGPERWEAAAFRKVPKASAEADAEFTAQIKGLKPSTVRA